MKRLIRAKQTISNVVELNLTEIVSIQLVDDVSDYTAKNLYVFAATEKKPNYSSFTREQLLQLPKKELAKIHDITILRKLHHDELTPKQYLEVHKANQDNFVSNITAVKDALQKLKECRHVRIMFSSKNDAFENKLWDMGADLQDRDVKAIIQDLHIKDYSYSTYSYLDINWNSLLMVFEYTGSHTFHAADSGSNDVTVDKMSIYIKVDINSTTGKGYTIMSFHEPEFKMSHPYKDYPIEKK